MAFSLAGAILSYGIIKPEHNIHNLVKIKLKDDEISFIGKGYLKWVSLMVGLNLVKRFCFFLFPNDHLRPLYDYRKGVLEKMPQVLTSGHKVVLSGRRHLLDHYGPKEVAATVLEIYLRPRWSSRGR